MSLFKILYNLTSYVLLADSLLSFGAFHVGDLSIHELYRNRKLYRVFLSFCSLYFAIPKDQDGKQ